MVTINCAYTEAINPAGVEIVLSREQVWKGLQRKIRQAQDFVPIIVDCKVLEEKRDEVTREAFFKQEGKEWSVREVCKSYWPTKVDFWQPSGALITNTVSDGTELDGVALNMTYTFEWRVEGVAEGSEEAAKLFKQYTEGAKMAVHSSIVAMREMAANRELD